MARVRQWAALDALADEDETLRPGLIAQVQPFVDTFRAKAAEPPVLYFAEYIDQWSVGFCQLIWIPKKCPYALVLNGGASVVAYQLPDAGKLRRHLSRKLKRLPRHMHEERWFLSHLHDVIIMHSNTVPQATLVIIRESWSASPDANEVIARSKTIPDWLEKL